MKPEKITANEQTSLEMTIAVVAILVMILETWVGVKGVPLLFQ